MSVKTAMVTIGKDVEIAAEDALHFVQKAELETPEVAGALGVLLGAIGKAIAAVQSGASQPTQILSLTFDQQVFTDLRVVWPDVAKFAATLGIKL
jgi:hypothetical protein